MTSRSIRSLLLASAVAIAAPAQHRGSAQRTATLDGPHFAVDSLEKDMATNPMLAARVQSLLPPGTSLQAAASGFKDEGQFIAALHISHNLNIPFNELKADLTGRRHGSLGGALRDLRPELHARVIDSQVKKAERQAKADLEPLGNLAVNAGN